MRADRLLSMMLLLHARGRMTAQHLADELAVSERTVYRDIEALSIAGVPIYTQPGANGGVFLDEQYRVSLTGLTETEVQALFVATDNTSLQELGLPRENMLLKLLAALPRMQRDKVDWIQQRLYIDTKHWFHVSDALPVLPMLHKAVWEDQVIAASYQPVVGERRIRQIEAYALVTKVSNWYLVGKEQGQMRNYRVGRLADIHLTGERFQRDPGFDLVAYWQESCRQFEEQSYRQFPPYPVLLRVHPDYFWVFPGYMEGRYEVTERGDWYTLRAVFESEGEARMRMLGLGVYVDILEPAALRQQVLETAQAIVQKFSISDRF